MNFREFTAGKDDDGRRLDRILRIFLKDLSLGEIYKLLRKGLIKVNNQKAKPEAHINQGDIILIAEFLFQKEKEPALSDSKNKNTSPDLNIIFENDDLLIIDKPYGISVHGQEGDPELLNNKVEAYYLNKKKEASSDSISFRPGPLHRLDRNTSGLLVFSMSLNGARWFSEGIKNHTLGKKYIGLAEGKLKNKETWEDKLADSEESLKGFYTVKEDSQGQTAVTMATPLAWGKLNNNEVTLVEYQIKTGRKHQIRAQSKIHGYPLAGDKAYGAKLKCKGREYFLQAYCLTFPKDNPLQLPQEIKMGLSPDFIDLLQCCEIENPGL